MPASPVIDRGRALRGGGFTLVELLAGISVLSLLVALLAGVFSQVSNAWTSGEGNIERRRSARALADFIGQELQGAALPIEGMSVAATGNLQFVVNPPVSQIPDAYRHADAIFWQAPLASETTFGDLAEIGYFVKWIEPDAAARKAGRTTPRPALCRFFANPSTTDDGGEGTPKISRNDAFRIYSSNPKEWLNALELETLAPADNDLDHAYRGLFAENVVGFWAQCYGLDGQDLFAKDRTFDSRVGYLCQFQTVDDKGIKQAAWSEQRFLPATVRISFAQVDSHTAPRLDLVWEKIQALSKSGAIVNADEFLAEVRDAARTDSLIATVLPGLRVYSTEIRLRNAR